MISSVEKMGEPNDGKPKGRDPQTFDPTTEYKEEKVMMGSAKISMTKSMKRLEDLIWSAEEV